MWQSFSLAAVLLTAAAAPAQQRADTNYDESKVPSYTLPDPLKFKNGEPVKSAAEWRKKRRPEVLQLFRDQMYGRSPAAPAKPVFELAGIDKAALGGKAVRKQVVVFLTGKRDGPKMDLLLYLPAGARRRVPVFLGLNFPGNPGVHADPGVQIKEIWTRQQGSRVLVRRTPEDRMRGASARQWQVEMLISRGYGLATAHYCDIEPDFDGGIGHGIRAAFLPAGQSQPAADGWGAIGAWAWGLSRALDYLETDKDVDARRVAVLGHSRLGKTALWAAAQDERFAMAISNNSGEGGASLSRRRFGETVRQINTAFPHWFCANFKQYNDREDTLPVDQHMLIALIAPRPVYVASAEEDRWADPRGEFLSAFHAGPVYRLLGKQGLETDRMPAIHQPVMNTVGYHIRAGKHDVTEYDWLQYIAFADKHLK